MEKQNNKYIAVAYKLYNDENGATSLIEEAPQDQPFSFVSGLGTTLEKFEENVVNLAKGDTFSLTMTPEEAYGDYEEERVLDLDKSMFIIDGRFDSEMVHVDAMVPLQNEDGNRFMGHVLEVTDDKVKVDLNHPLAGMTLRFEGTIVESRELTNEELQDYINGMQGGCGGCGGECGGNCDGESKHCNGEHKHEHKGKGGCCGGHCHHHHDEE